MTFTTAKIYYEDLEIVCDCIYFVNSENTKLKDRYHRRTLEIYHFSIFHNESNLAKLI